MTTLDDLKRARFGILTVVGYWDGKWHSVCDCGNRRAYSRWHYETGKVKSCGCQKGANVTANKTQPLKQRFFSFVRKTRGCWHWTGYKNAAGYGQFKQKGKMKPAHRVSYEILRKKIPRGLVIDHLCRNTSCVNPDHLEPVTNRENTARGRGFIGARIRKFDEGMRLIRERLK